MFTDYTGSIDDGQEPSTTLPRRAADAKRRHSRCRQWPAGGAFVVGVRELGTVNHQPFTGRVQSPLLGKARYFEVHFRKRSEGGWKTHVTTGWPLRGENAIFCLRLGPPGVLPCLC